MSQVDVERLANKVIGAAIEVHRHLGPGFGENIYHEALCTELRLCGIPFAKEVAVNIDYKGHPIGTGRLDMLVDSQLIVELKAVDTLAPIHTAQVISYLKATRLSLALLINFNVYLLKQGIKRIVL